MLQRVRSFMTQVDGPMLDRMIEYAKKLRPLVKRDNLGLMETEFILTMMIDLGIVEIDKMRPFVKQFRLFDVDGDARLSHANVEAAAKMDPKKRQEGMHARVTYAVAMNEKAETEGWAAKLSQTEARVKNLEARKEQLERAIKESDADRALAA
jgi:hypothetical protein